MIRVAVFAVAACGALGLLAATPAAPPVRDAAPGTRIAQSAGPANGAAATAAPGATATADALAYDDPAVHFRPPDGWIRVKLAAAPDANANNQAPPAAVYLFHAGRNDQRTIVLDIQPFVGTLDGFVSSHETELRNGADGTFVDKRQKTTLANGMPAYFLKVTQPGGQAGHQLRRFDYVTFDLKRSISAAYVGRYGDFDDDEAQKALSSLYVVVYPRDRR